MNRAELLRFLQRHRYAVQASTTTDGAPQAAVIGVAVNDALELVFDTLGTSRKAQNLRRDARIALVVGWDEEQTVQLEGVADEPSGEELKSVKATYFARFPDGPEREAWPDIAYFRVRLSWARYSDFRAGGGVVEVELG
ncbi:MAG TPA: pyridoxamine 5'-phosphate oxidase family protein [Polyangiaceae bacterium]|nr:pyridoxamine 5'-phosphate oxidase family protein [Polyangiaceae bacterium]